MCAHGEQETMAMPGWLREATGRTQPDVSIDRCIAPVLRSLWHRRIATLGCCCGHGETEPSLIIPSGDDPHRAQRHLDEIDPDRDWQIGQWRLMNVTELIPREWGAPSVLDEEDDDFDEGEL